VGASDNGDGQDAADGVGADIGGSFDIPIRQADSLRLEIGRWAWNFDEYGFPRARRDDRVTLRRITVGYVHSARAFAPVRIYVGAGGGTYQYDAAVGTFEAPNRFGLHFRVGGEAPLRRLRLALGGEFQLHVVRGPTVKAIGRQAAWDTTCLCSERPGTRDSPITSILVNVINGGATVRLYF